MPINSDSAGKPQVSFWPLLIGMAGLACVLLAGWRLTAADSGAVVSRTWLGPTPVSVFAPEGGAAPRATVVIAHGFAGSQQLMRPFAVTLARNGYRAVTFDFYGHGRNLEPLAGDVTQVEGATRRLVEQTRQVMDYALTLPQANAGLALLGHSMATDILVRVAKASAADKPIDATVAVSMFSPAVTADAPANLLMIVGGWEAALRSEAKRVLGLTTTLPEEGVTFGDFAKGTARRAVVAPGVEHVGVLYSETSMRESVDWLNGVFGVGEPPGYVDSRGTAILLLLFGIGLLGWSLAHCLPKLAQPAAEPRLTWRQLLPLGLVPAVLTPLLLVAFPADFLSVPVGGYLAVHFFVYGLISLACRWGLERQQGKRLAALVRLYDARRTWLLGALATLLATGYIAGLVALVLDRYVTSFAIMPPRIPLVFAMLVGTLVYFLVDEALTRGPAVPRGARLFSHTCFLVSLFLAVALSFQELFFLLIIAAVIVLYFFVYGLFGGWIFRATGHPAVGAVASAVAFAWALAVVFPMLSG